MDSLQAVVVAVWLAFTAGPPLLATEVEWNQKGTTWEDPGNWSTGQVPGPDDIAVFPAPREPVKNQPTVSGTVRVGGIVFRNGEPAGQSQAIKVRAEDHEEGEFPRPTILWGPYTWIINGAGKIVLGKNGIRLHVRWGRAGSVIFPAMELAADQAWEIGLSLVPRSVGTDHSNHRWRVYWKTQLMHNIFYGYGGAPELIVLGDLSGPGGLRKCGVGSLYYVNDHSPTFRGGTEISDGLIVWRPSRPGAYAFGTGPITFDSGGLRFTSKPNSKDAVRLMNPLRIHAEGGDIQTRYLVITDESIDGEVELGGLMKLSFMDKGMKWNAPRIILSQEQPATPGITDWECRPLPPLAMPIVDGPGGAGNPLVLQCAEVSILSSESRYAGPTIASVSPTVGRSWFGVIDVGPKAQLGQGDLIVEPGARMRLSAPGNLAPGAKALVKSNPRALGTLGVSYNGIPKITDDSEGVLSVECNDFDAVSDLSKLGNGRMYLGSRTKGTFVGRSLSPGKDNVYRLGGGSIYDFDNSGVLTMEHSVLNGNADVTVGEMSLLGSGGVLLKSAQSFSGRLTVQGPANTQVEEGFLRVGSCLEGRAQTQAGQSPFGAPAGAVRLINSTLKLSGIPGGHPVAKGELTFTGLCKISLDAKGSKEVGLILSKLVRDGRSALAIDPAGGHLGEQAKLLVADWKNDVDLLPACYLSPTPRPEFLSYNATQGKGFGPFTSYVTDLAKATDQDVVKLVGKTALPGGGRAVRALYLAGCTTGTGRIHIREGGLMLGGDLSADIDFGAVEGVIYTFEAGKQYQTNNLYNYNALRGKVSGRNGLTFQGRNFGGANSAVYLSNLQNDFTGPITINSCTVCAVQDKEELGKFIPGSLGDLKNDIILNGANLCWRGRNADRCIAPTRTIYLGPGGACLGGAQGHGGGLTLMIHAKITGPGFFTQWTEAGSAFVITNPANDYSGGTWISMIDDQGMETTVSETGKLGTGPVFVGRDAALLLRGDRNIDPGARLSVAYTGVVDFESDHPVIGSLEGSGFVFLGVRSAPAEADLPAVVGHDTTLVLGTDNTDFTFYGTIRQRGEKQGDGIGSLVKRGKGVFTLYGGHTYTGPTTVEQGTLDLRGGLAGDVVVKPEGTLKGSGRIARGLRLEGTLTVEACGRTVQPLKVAGAARLGGDLQVATPDGSAPAPGRKWTVLVAEGGITGHFERVTSGYRASIADDNKRLDIEQLAR